MLKKVLGVMIGLALLIWVLSSKEVVLGDGVFAPQAPEQVMIEQPIEFNYKGFKVKPLAEFSITAKVILREDYRFDDGAAISPTDLALGWGRMSDEAVLQHINFSQSGRWYRYRYQTAPIPQKEIETHSANMHMIPAQSWIKDDLDAVKPGQIVTIKGQLVEVHGENGWKWRSSLKRDDTGGGACELVYVESIKIVRDG
ncbi:hypothetical protein [Kangiella marina]|uniref:DUF5666 domain-containing protein n=1 Tax=Kangiella marina TaxID=1079178 RepID=A0ABP8IJA1_9GAMM